MRNVSGLEAVYRDYAPRGVKFFFIYKSLAHPELLGNYVQPFTTDERLAHAKQAIQQLGATVPWLVDPIDNRFKHALGDRPNSEFVIDSQGKIVRKRAWSNPIELRRDLEELVGRVEKITKAEDLNLKVQPALARPEAKGVIPRISRAGMFPLVAEPQLESGGEPFYAKLRPEADLAVIDEGKGQLYLGFHLDPFHQAHWNNLNKPLRFELEVPEGVQLSKSVGEAPRANAATDIDPREFLLDVKAWPKDKAMRLTVTYFACTDDACHEVRQVYVLHRQRDQDGGGAGRAGFRGLTLETMVQLLMKGDKNGDGQLTSKELNSIMQPRFPDFDRNHDGVLQKEEIQTMAEMNTRKE